MQATDTSSLRPAAGASPPPMDDVVRDYQRDGFHFPHRAVSAEQAAVLRADLEAAEAELADRPGDLALLRSYPDRVLPSFDALIRTPALVSAAAAILGPDLMVWSAGLFIKEANSSARVTWHQDLTYWGLDDAQEPSATRQRPALPGPQELTTWVALSTANRRSGCMRFVPGSHLQRQVAHADSFADDNLLSRGQEIAVEVNEADAVDIELEPGEASLHHGHLFHSSEPNGSDDRRIGVAIRYISPTMRQQNGTKSLVAHVAGEDRHGHFTVAAPPAGRLLDEDLARCRADAEAKRAILYAGAEQAGGKRY